MEKPETMTISQALRRMSKLKGQLAEHLDRAVKSVTYLEKSPPAFQFSDCMEKASAVRTEMVALSAAIAVANANSKVEWAGERVSLIFAVKELEDLKGQLAWVKGLSVRNHKNSSEETEEYALVSGDHKYVKVEKVYLCDLPEAAKAELAASLQDQFDRLNDIVEQTNHRTAVAVP